MARPTRYIKGPKIRDPLAMFQELVKGRYVYWNHKPQHPSWLLAMQANTLIRAARDGTLSFAIANPDWIEK